MHREFDILVVGATGFTGKYVARELFAKAPVKNLKWAAGARSKTKLEETLAWMEAPPGSVPTVIVDVADPESLEKAAHSTRVLVNCVGPFRYTGVEVVKACIAAGTDYVDISGEPEFIERILTLSPAASEAKVTVVPCCGFDSIPADLGNLFAKQEFAKRGFTAASVEMYIDLKSGPTGLTGNFATYESAVFGVSNASVLRKMRKEANRPALPRIGKRLILNSSPRFENLFTKKWCIPFPGADSSVVRTSQQIMLASGQNQVLPTQFNAYITATLPQLAAFVVLGFSIFFLSPYKWGRKVLLDHPGIFSLGLFSKSGPTEQQIKESGFVSTFVARGFKKLPNAEGAEEAEPDFEMVVKVEGPEVGYVTTPITLLACAYKLLEDRKHRLGLIPYGVMTPAAAFANTHLIQDIESSKLVSFSVDGERDL